MLLKVTGLAHSFPGTARLFEDLSFEAQPGQTVAVVGPSGCGKSTLLSIIAGWQTPVAGTVERVGIETVCWVFQNPYGVARRTALDHVVVPLLARGRRRREAVREADDILDLFNLGELRERQFRLLSGGEAQRLMLARAVAVAPDVLLVDEPTAQLDLATAATVNQVLGQVAISGAIVLIATHDPHTREACSRVLDLTDVHPAARAQRLAAASGSPAGGLAPGAMS